jgi:hypothetical protein
MPSQTVAVTLIHLWMLDAPWDYPTWQEITNVYHGLFPENDRFLPKTGKVAWSRTDAQDVESFFKQYETRSTGERVKFFQESRLPGRAIWLKFVTKGWEKWTIHNRIINQLNIHNIHPLKLMLAEGNVTDWPNASDYLSEALEGIGVDLFGPEALSPMSNRLPRPVRDCVRMLTQQTWLLIRKQVERSRVKIGVLEKDALDLVSSSFSKFVIFQMFLTFPLQCSNSHLQPKHRCRGRCALLENGETWPTSYAQRRTWQKLTELPQNFTTNSDLLVFSQAKSLRTKGGKNRRLVRSNLFIRIKESY